MLKKMPFLLKIPLITKIRRLWAKKILEVSAGTIVFYFPKHFSEPEFLLIERGEPFNDWIFPKGKIEIGEEIKQAALRETKEETGLDVSLFEELPPYSYTYFWDPTNEKSTKTVHYFLAKSDVNTPNFNNHPDTGNERKSFRQVKFFKSDDVIKLVKRQAEKDVILSVKQKILSNPSIYQK